VENLTLTNLSTGSEQVPTDIYGTGNPLNNVIIGNSGANTLRGEAGDDILDGGPGNDTMVGGAGDDTYVVECSADVVAESLNSGTDSVQSCISFTLTENVENLTLTNPFTSSGQTTADIDGIGNALDNIITGNSGNNILRGGAGNDSLAGGRGNDSLLGGEGDDRYLFRVGDGSDCIFDLQGNNTLYAGSGLSDKDLEAERVGDDMLVHVVGSSDFVTLSNWFVQSEGVNVIEFDDGTVLGREGIELLMNRPPAAVDDSITVFEDGGPVVIPEASLLANDTDPNPNDVLTVLSVGESEIQASVSLVKGEIAYDIGGRFQELGPGAVLRDHFACTISDAKGATATGIVEVGIVGVNDAPVLARPLPDQDFTFNKPFSWEMPAGSFIDIDNGDVLDYAATMADGSVLPDWLNFDAETLTFSGWAPKKTGFADIRVTATDRVAATGSTAACLSASDVFRLTVSHGNEGVGNGQDASPAGHDSNWNDGPGTAPGLPGARIRQIADKDSDKGHTPAPVNSDNGNGFSQTPMKVSNYLDVSRLEDPARELSRNTESSRTGNEILLRWQAMNCALADDASRRDNGAWQCDGQGADIAPLGKAAVGFVGSSQSWLADSFTLSAGSGTSLKCFKGLKEGVRLLA
jgi:hypothetical protein